MKAGVSADKKIPADVEPGPNSQDGSTPPEGKLPRLGIKPLIRYPPGEGPLYSGSRQWR
jgi:hypothetical protein